MLLLTLYAVTIIAAGNTRSSVIERGHRKIGHLAGNRYSNTTRERVRGYVDAMKESGIPVSDYSIYYGNLDRESGYKFGETIIKEDRGYSAVFCGNDLMADGLCHALRDYGVRGTGRYKYRLL